MATPAQIANDMLAHANFWAKRDRDIERACRDAARVIRAFLAGAWVDGRTYYGVWRRLLHLADYEEDIHIRGYPNFDRARLVIEKLYQQQGARQS